MNIFIKTFDNQFLNLHRNSCKIIENIPADKLFWKPIETYSALSSGEYILRSAGLVEQTFGGIMTRLWDDPFEWTLPEELSTNEKILDYLNEVEANRLNGFAFFNSDEDLKKEIPALDEMKTLFKLLMDTLTKAENWQGRAITTMHLFQSQDAEKHRSL